MICTRVRIFVTLASALVAPLVSATAFAQAPSTGEEPLKAQPPPAAPTTPSAAAAAAAVAAAPAPTAPRVATKATGGTNAARTSNADTLQPTLTDPVLLDKAGGPWDLGVFGYLRAGYDHSFKDDRYEFIGRNNGFLLDSARVGLQGGNRDYGVTFRVSIEGASDVLSAPNTPIGTLAVRLRDSFVRWDPFTFFGIQGGQFKAPFQEEEVRAAQSLLFASRAVGVDGVAPGRGFQLPGIQLDRQLGVMLSPIKPIGSEDVSVSYYLMVMNGNGSNQLLDDNGRVGLVARTEVNIFKVVKAGAALFRNDRTVGTPPNLYNEEDLGLTGDVGLNVSGLEVFGAVTRIRTVFPTVGTSARVQLAFHGQLGYRFDLPGFDVTPAYRYAYFHPWQDGGGGFDNFKLQYHTFGARVAHAKLPLTAWLNYTVTGEEEGRKLTNDRIEILGQVTF